MQSDIVQRLEALYVWPQSVADHHADILTPRQIEKLYAVGQTGTEAAAEITRLTEALRAAEEREKALRADLRRCFRGETHAVRNERVNRKILEYTEAALKGPSHD